MIWTNNFSRLVKYLIRNEHEWYEWWWFILFFVKCHFICCLLNCCPTFFLFISEFFWLKNLVSESNKCVKEKIPEIEKICYQWSFFFKKFQHVAFHNFAVSNRSCSPPALYRNLYLNHNPEQGRFWINNFPTFLYIRNFFFYVSLS